ncbi:MAG: ankyrin repeat domain-containing protein [Candidatus Micrarchaeota archaeon]
MNELDNQLFEAVKKEGNDEAVKELIEKGADVNAKEKYGWTVLMLAALNGSLQTAELLIKKGADVNAKDANGTTVLMAVAWDDMQIARLLIANGADVNAKDKDGNTALTEAVSRAFPKIAAVLIANGADVNAKDKNGNTALSWAVTSYFLEKDYIGIAESLIDKGAKVTDGWTALNITKNIIAKDMEIKQIFKLLKNATKTKSDKDHVSIFKRIARSLTPSFIKTADKTKTPGAPKMLRK